MSFTEANITNISNDGFDLALLGSLTNIGPLDAQITFTEPLTITWNDNKIAEIDVPDGELPSSFRYLGRRLKFFFSLRRG